MTERALFIVNPTAGAGRAGAIWGELLPRLRECGLGAEQAFSAGPGEAARLAQQAAGEYELVVAVGGDGTVSEVAGGILSARSRRAALGIVPLGTGNDVAAGLGLHTRADALTALSRGRRRAIDVIEVRCVAGGQAVVRHALLFAGVGIISEVLQRTTPAIKSRFGRRLAYRLGLIGALCGYRAPWMRVTCGGQVWQERFLFVGASNSDEAGGGMKIAPGAQMDDGRLNLNLVEAMGRWAALSQVRRLCQGRHTTHPRVRYFEGTSLTVEAEPPIAVAADGDLIGQTPAEFEVRPQALEVVVNRGKADVS